MAGYGKAEAILETGKITVEVRSLNGKTADISLKTSMLPKDKEMAVRQKIAASLTRGNIDFFITFEPNAAESAKKINMALAMEYYSQISELGSQLGAHNLWSQNPNDLLAIILRMPEVMDAKKQDVITVTLHGLKVTYLLSGLPFKATYLLEQKSANAWASCSLVNVFSESHVRNNVSMQIRLRPFN